MESELRTLIADRNRLSKEIGYQDRIVKNTFFPDLKDAEEARNVLYSLQAEYDAVVDKIRRIDETILNQKMKEHLKQNHEAVTTEIFVAGSVSGIPWGELSLDDDLHLQGSLPCGHQVSTRLLDLLSHKELRLLLVEPNTVSVSTFYCCPVERHSGDRDWPDKVKGRGYKLEFSLPKKLKLKVN